MNITKDEARILAAAIKDFKYEIFEEYKNPELITKIELLEDKLRKYGKDKRRTGRTSLDGWHDLITRFAS